MIPRLTASLPDLAPGLFDALIEAGFRGDLEAGAASRVVMATDNSVYQIAPQAVIHPMDGEDLALMARVLARPEHRHHRLTPRGGGTGTNGQALSPGLVVDLSRHMTRILSIDPIARRARVQAGVVKDQLNRALAPHGLFFAPELSTSNRATIGGMVATDASGQGSCLYGKTSDHVRGLRLILEDGSDQWSAPGVVPQGLLARAAAVVQAIARDQAGLIAATYPSLNRFLTGYDLVHLHDAQGRFDLNRVICGSEGTLALVAEVEVNLLPLPAHAALLTVQYADFDTALQDARLLTGLGVASVETVDEKVLGLARGDLGWQGIAAHFPPAPGSRGVNLVELLADTPEALEAAIARVQGAFADATPRVVAVVRGARDIAAIWAMRKRAVGLLGALPGPARPLPFVEDTAVPPENLAAYIRAFRALLDAEGLDYGMFGHVDAGVLHVRPALDLTDPDLRAKLRRITDAVVDLVQAHGGVLWGEHGKGLRSDHVPAVFGALYPALQAVKAAFDPDNRLNPGKIATPPGGRLTRLEEPPMRGDFDRGLTGFPEAMACNGNGACFDFDPGSAMCPSYKATRDRRQSPKGRAALVREWLRLVGPLPIRPAGWLRRAWNTLNPANRHDFSHQVAEAMAGCLSCKACAGQCPVKVDVPAFRARFLMHYHGRYLRPFRARLMAEVETLLPLVPRPLWNLGVQSGLLRGLGLAALPLKKPGRVLSDPAPTVVFVLDPFTAQFDPEVVTAACRLARAMGHRPGIVTPRHGKALQVQGLLARFERLARATHAQMASLSVPLVGLDPAMTLIFRDDYAKLGLALPVLLPQEWLAGQAHRLPPLDLPQDLTLLLHCTERATQPQAGADWARVFAALGAPVALPAAGCCGMAGTFGHETRNRPVSARLCADWAPRLTGTPTVTGYSCRAQAEHLGARRPPHPLQLLAAALPKP